MIRIQLTPNRLVVLSFCHPVATVKPRGLLDPIMKRTSICKIYEGEGESEKLLGRGEVRVHHKDRWTRETGRKEALKRALQAAGFEQMERAQIWAGYFNRPRPKTTPSGTIPPAVTNTMSRHGVTSKIVAFPRAYSVAVH